MVDRLSEAVESGRVSQLRFSVNGEVVCQSEGGIDVDYKASGVPLDSDGKPDHRARDKDQKGPLAVKLDSWNGKDLFSTRRGVPMVVYCTERIKNLAEEKGWTNVKLEENPIV